MNITVYGSGYVGLVSGACLADAGHHVLCVDVDQRKIDSLRNGVLPIYEPGLAEIVQNNAEAGRLQFSCDAAQGVAFGPLQFIAVGTPPDEDGRADLKHVLTVATEIGRHIDDYRVIINKSTVPVGTTDLVREAVSAQLLQRGLTQDFDVCSNPEFLRGGAAVEDFKNASRIIVGTASERVAALMQECYAPFTRDNVKLIVMDERAAELTKYAANAMLASKISFINEIANLSERLGADMESVRRGMGTDPRIGFQFINPGCGYGGSCFPKDVQALVRTADDVGYDAELLRAIESVNLRQKETLFAKLSQALDGRLRGRTIALWGLAFKPNTDDMREAPSRTLMKSLWREGAKVQAYDPEAGDQCLRIYGQRDDLKIVASRDAALDGADALVVCTEWKEFHIVDPAILKAKLKTPVVIDGRNIYNPDTFSEAGILYYGVGRGASINVQQSHTQAAE